MDSHQIYRTAMRRGDAKFIARELGVVAEVPRRWLRPMARPDNLETGALSHLERGKIELKAEDRVNQETADILLFDLFHAVAQQRVEPHADTRDAVAQALAHGFRQSIVAVLNGENLSLADREAELYRAGGSVSRAIAFCEAERMGPTREVPLRRASNRNWVARLIARLFIDELPFLCRFRHAWDTGAEIRRCRRQGCGRVEPGFPRR